MNRNLRMSPDFLHGLHQHMSNALLEVLTGKDVREVGARYNLDPDMLDHLRQTFTARIEKNFIESFTQGKEGRVASEARSGVVAMAIFLAFCFVSLGVIEIVAPVRGSPKSPIILVYAFLLYLPGLASFGLTWLSAHHHWGATTRRLVLYFALLPGFALFEVILTEVSAGAITIQDSHELIIGVIISGLILGFSDYVLS